jgi:hypothetical protein
VGRPLACGHTRDLRPRPMPSVNDRAHTPASLSLAADEYSPPPADCSPGTCERSVSSLPALEGGRSVCLAGRAGPFSHRSCIAPVSLPGIPSISPHPPTL